ncbi:M15 family metallopeptidase, partial [Serratia marcescens]|uniref:M15 family metallopeptidase n=1 Tax=Serratia marcescens TaxID=615 RepID=UPI0013DB712B
KKTPNNRKVLFADKPTQEERAREVRFLRADTDMTPALIADALAIKTKAGLPIFAWGGHFKASKDAMHFQIDVSPQELAEGVDDGPG